MLATTIAHYTSQPEDKIEGLLLLSTDQVLGSPYYQSLVTSLDKASLFETLPHARAAYKEGLPGFKEKLSSQYDFTNSPMSAYTLANWLVGFLDFPDELMTLSEYHMLVPDEVMREGLPHLLEILNTMPEGRANWQRAMSILSIPLVCRGK